jgi:SAM-dependent methyltransferase
MHSHLYETFYDIEDTYWWSVGTRRIFFELIDRVRPAGAPRTLDVGCGTGVMLANLRDGGIDAAGCDYSAQALSFCRRRGLERLVRADATRLPLAADSFDLVLALDVVEHLDDDVACVREMARVCRPGGHVLVHVPAFPLLWNAKDVLNHHRRRYRRAAMQRLIESSGLIVEHVRYVNVFLFPVAVLVALYTRAFRHENLEKPDPNTLDYLHNIPDLLNRALIGLLDVERRLGNHLRLPFGMSLLYLARKD